MKILLFTNHFYPEEFRCNDIAFELVKRGHQVKVLTGIPDYPQGKFHKGYSLFKKRIEKVNGVEVVRVPLIPRGKGGKIRMVLNYASSLFFFIFYALYQALFHKYDCIYIHDTSPAFVCIPAVLVKKIRRTPLVLWILDMWPESLVAGGVQNEKVFGAVRKMMRWVYSNCDKIQISSQGFKKLLVTQKVDPDKIEYFPNWSDDALTSSVTREILPLPEGFKIMFAGNLGEAQNLENVMQAANRLKDKKDIKWIFLGDGRKKPWMEDFIKDNELEDTVYLLGRHPIEEMPAYFAQADVMLVSLCDEVVFNNTLPAKVQAYMSCKKTIIGFLNGEGQEVINAAKCGYSANADDIDSLVNIINNLATLPKSEIQALGENGYLYYKKQFDKAILMNRVDNTLKIAATPPPQLIDFQLLIHNLGGFNFIKLEAA